MKRNNKLDLCKRSSLKRLKKNELAPGITFKIKDNGKVLLKNNNDSEFRVLIIGYSYATKNFINKLENIDKELKNCGDFVLKSGDARSLNMLNMSILLAGLEADYYNNKSKKVNLVK